MEQRNIKIIVVAIIGLIIIFTVGFFSFYYFEKKNMSDNQTKELSLGNKEKQDAQKSVTTRQEDQIKGEALPEKVNQGTQNNIHEESVGTISDLLNSGVNNKKCSFSTSIANPYDGNKMFTYSGNVYVSDNMVRIDHDSPVSDSNVNDLSSHVIFDGRYSYTWSNSMQLKVDVTKYFPSVRVDKDNEKFLDPIDVSRQYSFNCEKYTDKSVFIPPSDLNFTELVK